MQVQFWATTDVGQVRGHNEDNFLVDRQLNLFVVCDGMGGHAAGEVASAVAVRTVHEIIVGHRQVIEELRADPQQDERREAVQSLMEHAIKEASGRIYRASQADAERGGMGTTCSMMLVHQDRGFVGHVGDSRIYRLRDGSIEQVTDDHSLLNEMIRQGRAKEGDEIPNKNAVTRAVGVQETVEVDTFEIELLDEDRYLMCSDGLSEYVEDREVLGELMSHQDLKSCADACIDHANSGGGKDNITVIMLEADASDMDDESRVVSDTLEALETCPYFDFATTRELVQLSGLAEQHTLDVGEVLLESGEVGDGLYMVAAGTLGAIHEGRTVSVLETGDFFGAANLLDAGRLEESYEALEPSRVLVVGREPLFELLKGMPRLGSKVMWALARDFASKIRHVPPELRFYPKRWNDVALQQDEDVTPPPGGLVVDESSLPEDEDVQQLDENDLIEFDSEATVELGEDGEEDVDLNAFRETVQIDMDDTDS